MSEDAGIEPRTVATSAMVISSNHSAISHLLLHVLKSSRSKITKTFLLSLSQVWNPFPSVYCSPKNQISRSPIVFTTWRENKNKVKSSVSDPGCLYWIPDPNFSKPDPQIQGQKDSGSRIRGPHQRI